MQDQSLTIRPSKFNVRMTLYISIPLTLLCLWLAYQLMLGKQLWDGFGIALFFDVFCLFLIVALSYERLSCTNGQFIHRTIIGTRIMQLDTVERVERYWGGGRYPQIMYRFTDTKGMSISINPSNYGSDDLYDLGQMLRPYLLRSVRYTNLDDLSQIFYKPADDATVAADNKADLRRLVRALIIVPIVFVVVGAITIALVLLIQKRS